VRQQLEKTEQAAIVQLLRTIGASVYVIGTRRRKGDYQGTGNTAGVPDVYAVLPWIPTYKGRLGLSDTWTVPVWIEVKAPKGRPSKAQEQFQVESTNCRIPHLIGGIDVVTHWLRQGGWIK
jgi:hypothetical protein